MTDKKILIVGAGISGLTIGYELSKRDYKVIIVETESDVGGLAKSFQYDGFTFDIGPHRFYTINSKTRQFIKQILDDEMTGFYRHTGVYMFEEYLPWPLRPTVLFKLPINIMVKSGIDLLFKLRRKAIETDSFRDYICNRYGVTLYELFFKKYTEKFLGLSIDEVHSDWAEASIDKAVIDKHIVLENLTDILKFTIMPVSIQTEFHYPKKGMGYFCKKLASFIKQNEGIILTNTPVTEIKYAKNTIEAVNCNGVSFEPYRLIWTASIATLCELLGFKAAGLDYLSLLLFNIELRKPLRNKFQWCYYGGKDVVFNRVSIPLTFSKDLVPDGKASLCVELTCRQNDRRWDNAEELIEQVRGDLKKVNLIEKIGDIASVHIERISDAYPIYRLGYQQRLYKIKEEIQTFKNLTLAGRSGLFWYNNMNDSIENGLAVAEEIFREELNA